MRGRLARLAEMIRKDGAPYPLTATLVKAWVDVFVRAQITVGQASAAFDEAERRVKFWPAPAEVLGFISTANDDATEVEAAKKWDTVLAYAMRTSPDYPDKNPPRISEHTGAAIRAAGGLTHIRECDSESLPWARKRFIESYVQWSELERDQFLLPDGEIKSLIAGVAEAKSVPRLPEGR